MKSLFAAAILLTVMPASAQSVNPYTGLMQQASIHAGQHGARIAPVLSPKDDTVLDQSDPAHSVDVAALHQAGVRVIPWTTNDPEKMRAVIRTGVDGLISDRPDLLQKVVAEERAAARTPADKARLALFDVSGHRGGRGLRPENTLPSFESGMDQGIDTIETDTGVTSDHVSLIWHDQFLNPQSCRRADGAPYTLADRVYIRDISMAEAQKTFICDKLPFGPALGGDQKNDLALSPVSAAFAAQEKLISPYVPTHAAQLFRFTRFYTDYYRTGPGKSHPEAARRALTAERVKFNLETKIIPELSPAVVATLYPNIPPEYLKNHTVSPQLFVDALCGAIVAANMQARADVQSFDFRTLQLVEEQFPGIPTYYLTENTRILSTDFLPPTLRQ